MDVGTTGAVLGVGGTSVTSAFKDVDRLASGGHKSPSVKMSFLVSRVQGSLKPFSFLVIFHGDLDAGVPDTCDFRDRSLLAIEVVILLVSRCGVTVFAVFMIKRLCNVA